MVTRHGMGIAALHPSYELPTSEIDVANVPVARRPAFQEALGERMVPGKYPLNLGGNQTVQHNRTIVAGRDGASCVGARKNRPGSAGNYTNSGRGNQTADRH